MKFKFFTYKIPSSFAERTFGSKDTDSNKVIFLSSRLPIILIWVILILEFRHKWYRNELFLTFRHDRNDWTKTQKKLFPILAFWFNQIHMCIFSVSKKYIIRHGDLTELKRQNWKIHFFGILVQSDSYVYIFCFKKYIIIVGRKWKKICQIWSYLADFFPLENIFFLKIY